MNEKNFSKHMKTESIKREKIMSDVMEELNSYSNKLLEKEHTFEQSKIDEIKYKTTISELNEYIEMYKEKLNNLESINDKYEKELKKLRKEILKNDTDLKTFKSILELLVQEYGLDKIVEITNLKKSKIKELMEIGE